MIEHCCTTLACIKSASLFNESFDSESEAVRTVRYWASQLESKGVSIEILRMCGGNALIYVYRRQMLHNDLRKPGAEQFLRKYGYTSIDVDCAVDKLKERLGKKKTFPHEIGLFLGYPLGDVIGFIENEGKNCKCTGCWKVYCDQCQAEKTFALMKKCRDTYMRLWHSGLSVQQLTQAV